MEEFFSARVPSSSAEVRGLVIHDFKKLRRRTCSPEDPTQRQCAWLLTTYLKEGEKQKEVPEAEDDEEKEREINGEVEERESLNVRMRHGDDCGINEAKNSSP